jgi:hypothetical protein
MPAASAGAAISNSGWRTAGDEAHPGEPAAHRPPTPAATRQSRSDSPATRAIPLATPRTPWPSGRGRATAAGPCRSSRSHRRRPPHQMRSAARRRPYGSRPTRWCQPAAPTRADVDGAAPAARPGSGRGSRAAVSRIGRERRFSIWCVRVVYVVEVGRRRADDRQARCLGCNCGSQCATSST